MTNDYITTIDLAKQQLVNNFPGGAKRLAELAGMRPMVLSNKVNPEQESNHLSVDEAIRLMAITGDKRLLVAINSALGCTAMGLARTTSRCKRYGSARPVFNLP